MPVVQFSNSENLRMGFERKHNKEMNGKNMCIYLGVLHSKSCLFLLDLFATYHVYFQTIERFINS